MCWLLLLPPPLLLLLLLLLFTVGRGYHAGTEGLHRPQHCGIGPGIAGHDDWRRHLQCSCFARACVGKLHGHGQQILRFVACLGIGWCDLQHIHGDENFIDGEEFCSVKD